LAIGLQKSGFHKRIALYIIHFIGSKQRSLILGFMVASAFLSMWISNTASVMVMLPVALSVVETIREREEFSKNLIAFAAVLMLGIAYAADIGGMSTVIGTPPNLVFLELFTQLFPKGPQIGFLQWMIMILPMSIIFLFLGWILLTRFIFRLSSSSVFSGKALIRNMIADLGPIRRDEKITAAVFSFAAILWMTGSDLQLTENIKFVGWRNAFGLQSVVDGAVAIGASSLLFLIPSKDRPGEKLLEWKHSLSVPWGILLLFGGGFAIATGFQESGLSNVVGQLFESFDFDSPIALVIVVNTILTFLTEIMSNTAMANLALPILSNASVALEIDPRILMIPATLSASCAFMMPVASPTQAIVFGSKYLTIGQMIRAGIWFNLLGIVLVTICFLLIGVPLLHIDSTTLPAWAFD